MLTSQQMSKLLADAADYHLADDDNGGYTCNLKQVYSCNAVMLQYEEDEEKDKEVLDFLRLLGMPNHAKVFPEFAAGEERQGARYLWLKFASLVAKDGL